MTKQLENGQLEWILRELIKNQEVKSIIQIFINSHENIRMDYEENQNKLYIESYSENVVFSLSVWINESSFDLYAWKVPGLETQAELVWEKKVSKNA
jgi:hypothetical protein